MLCPNIEWMVTVRLGDGPLPVGVMIAVPMLSGPAVVEDVTVMVLPVPRQVWCRSGPRCNGCCCERLPKR